MLWLGIKNYMVWEDKKGKIKSIEKYDTEYQFLIVFIVLSDFQYVAPTA